MRPTSRHLLAVCAILAVTLVTAAPVAATAPARRHTYRPALISLLCRQMLRLLNRDRAGTGAAPLVLDRLLTSVATGHSRDMALHHYFAHDSLDGADPFTRMTRMGVRFSTAAENIGRAFSISATQALAILNAEMMAEPLTEGTHHAIIVSRFLHRVGIGIYLAPGQAVYLTEDFTN